MPKERIRDYCAGSYDVIVGWQPEQDVQVGVVTSKGHSLLTMLYGTDEAMERIGLAVADALELPPRMGTAEDVSAKYRELTRTILDVMESEPVDGPGTYRGVWSTLDRAAVNRLIRVLRRARDAAYGRDE